MAEPYQLPGQFQVPSMAEISYAAGDQQAGANANWKMFTDQVRTYTDINNANRLQSLREKEFVQRLAQDQRDFDRRIMENDRQFGLNEMTQTAQAKASDLQYQLNEFRLRREQTDLDQLQQSFNSFPEIQAGIEALLPNGGKMSTSEWLMMRPKIKAQFAKNPAQAAVVEQILAGYDADNKSFSNEAVVADQGKVLSWIRGGSYSRPKYDENGEFIGSDPILFNGKTAYETYNEALAARIRGDDVTYEALMEPLRDAGSRSERRKQAVETVQEDIGISRATGVPIYQIERSAKGELKTTFQPSRVYGARGAGGDTGVKTFSESDVKLLENRIQSIDTEIGVLNEKLGKEDNPLRKAGIEAEKAGLEAQKNTYTKTLEMGVSLIQQKAQQQLPQTNQPTQAPAQPAGRVRPQNILKPPTMPAPSGTPVSGSMIQPRGMTVTPSGIQFQAPVSAGLPVRSAGTARPVSG